MIISIVFSCSTLLFAQAPPLINYQGRLTDEQARPVANGTRNLTFNIYDFPTTGSVIWGPQTFQNVPVINGYFNVILGENDEKNRSLTDAFHEPNRYLSVSINGNSEVLPRQQILSAPYSLYAEIASSLTSFPVPNYITGCELEYVDQNNFKVLPGFFEMEGQLISRKNSSDKININDANNWLHGNIAANIWVYVYLTNFNNMWIIKLSDEPPNLFDSEGNKGGKPHFRNYNDKYYRCIGAIRTNTSLTLKKFWRDGNMVLYDEPISLTIEESLEKWTQLDLKEKNALPVFLSRTALFGIGGETNHNNRMAGVWLRPFGAIWSTDIAAGMYDEMGPNTSNDAGLAGQLRMQTDSNGLIEYRTKGDFNTFEIKVLGYWLNPER